MNLAWEPLTLAAVTGTVTVVLYLTGKAPRAAGFLAAATVLFFTVGVPSLLAMAHRPVTGGLYVLITLAGAAGSVALFYFMVFKGHHKRPLLKMKGGSSGAGAQGGGSGKAPHHRAMVATVGVMVFTFLLVSNWQTVFQTATGGLSQTIHGITQ